MPALPTGTFTPDQLRRLPEPLSREADQVERWLARQLDQVARGQ